MTTPRPISRVLAISVALAALAALIWLALPALGALAFFGRVLAVALVPAFLLALIFSRRLRAWLEDEDAAPAAAPDAPPPGVLLHPAHAWAHVEALDRVKVGMDDFVPLVLGPAEQVMLPEVGAEVAQGQPLFTVWRGKRHLTLRAPVSGTVVATNVALSEDPALATRAPFSDGWALTLKPTALGREKVALTPVERAGVWLRGEADRLLGAFAEPGFATMQDGGELAEDLHTHLDDAAFARVKAALFADHTG